MIRFCVWSCFSYRRSWLLSFLLSFSLSIKFLFSFLLSLSLPISFSLAFCFSFSFRFRFRLHFLLRLPFCFRVWVSMFVFAVCLFGLVVVWMLFCFPLLGWWLLSLAGPVAVLSGSVGGCFPLLGRWLFSYNHTNMQMNGKT